MTFSPRTREPEPVTHEPPSFEGYVAMRGPALVRFAILLTGDDHRAEDLVQDVLAKAYLRWRSIRRSDNPDVYLRRMLVNASHSWWRRRRNREVPVEHTGDRAAPGDIGTDAGERDALWRLVTALPHQQRAVVALRYYEDLDDATIAEILSCSPATVRTHAMRALNRLRGHVGADLKRESEDPEMIDLEARLGESLRARAERGVEVDRLRAGAMARARTSRRRRNLLGGLAVVALVAAGAVAAPLALSGGDGSRRTGRPTIVGVPATNPGTGIASNPATLHFDLDPATLDSSGHLAVSTEWISAATYERAILYDADGNQWATLLLARTQSDLDAAVNPPPPSGPTRAAPEPGPEQDTTVDGHPATIQRTPQVNRVYWLLRWHPADGVYAAVVSTGEEQSLAHTVAGALRLNQVQRCVASLRLTELPAGAVWVECQTAT